MSNRHFLRSAAVAAALLVSVSLAGAQVPLPAPAAPAASAFTPPANGKLTADQIRMFIAVRRATAASAERWPADPETQINALMRSFGEEARAAEAAGAGLDEYRWVSAQIADAMPGAVTANDALLGAIAAAVKNAPALIADASAAPGSAVKPPEPSASARAYNRQLLGRFQTELRAVMPARHP